MADALRAEEILAPVLLSRFRSGDRDAFLEVYRTFAADVRRWVDRYFSRPFEQEEAVQEIWLMVHRQAGTFDPARGPLRGWLRTLAVNRCRELLRAKGRRLPDGDELEEALESPGGGPESAVRATRLREAVQQFAATLEPDEAKMLELGLLEGHSHEEVARALGVSVRRCKYLKKKILSRAAGDSRLRQALEELE